MGQGKLVGRGTDRGRCVGVCGSVWWVISLAGAGIFGTVLVQFWYSLYCLVLVLALVCVGVM